MKQQLTARAPSSGVCRGAAAIAAIVLGAFLLLGVPSMTKAQVGSPVPTSAPSGQPPAQKSSPNDRRNYNRRALPSDITDVGGALPPGYTLVDTVVANSDPNLASTDTVGDSENSMAVDGSNPNRLAIYGGFGGWASGNAPVWYSTNGGATWTKRFTIPPPAGVSSSCPCDTTLDYDRSSRLFGTFLHAYDQFGNAISNDIYTGDSTNPASSTAWQWFTVGGIAQKTDRVAGGSHDVDQPWIRITRDPGTATQDNTYVGYDDFDASPTRIRVAVAPGSRPPNFTRDNSPGIANCCVNPGTRLAVDHRNGTVYVIWQYATGTNGDGSVAVQYALSRSTDGGVTWSLNGSTSGIVVANANSNQPTPKFGTVNALLGGVDHAAVDPSNGDLYYVYGKKDSSTGKNRLAIRRLTANGTGGMNIGSERFVTGQVEAALPSVAVASNGTIGVLYTTSDGLNADGFPRFSHHLAKSNDHGATFSDTKLITFASPAKDNGDTKQRVLGDYQQLRNRGNTFYGAMPVNGAAFGRSQANIDPVLLKAPAGSTPDFNGDGFADLAVGVPNEDVGGLTDAGAVHVLYGSASGLQAGGGGFFAQSSAGGTTETGDRFGTTVSTGDFNRDGFSDLAVGAPFEDIESADAGGINVLYGGASGIDATGNAFFSQADAGGTNEAGDRFGAALATGDFDGSGDADLAVGAPNEDIGSVADAGAINVLYGGASGIDTIGNAAFSQADANGATEAGDRFGAAVAAGDFNNSRHSDLAVGAPNEDLSVGADAGGINVLYGGASGIDATGNAFFSQNSAGSTAEADDRFGAALATGDFNGSGHADVAVGAPYEDFSGSGNAGAVNVLYGGASGIDASGNTERSQTQGGGTIEAGDHFGAALAVGDFNNSGKADLAVGAPEEDFTDGADAGAISVLYGGDSGIGTTGNLFGQNSAGGTIETDDRFGAALAATDYDKSGHGDLAAGSPEEDVGSAGDAGAVHLLYGGPVGIDSTGNVQFTQASTGSDATESGDRFAHALP
jgi:hypothetical protein